MKRKAMAYIHHNDGVVSVRAFIGKMAKHKSKALFIKKVRADLIEHGDEAGGVDSREARNVAEGYMNPDGTANYAGGDGDFIIDEIDLES